MRSVKKMLASGAVILFATLHAVAAENDRPQAPVRDGYLAAETGLIYKDAAADVIIYVETDGRHVAAISPAGKLLWRKNPFVDAGMQPYRQARPVIDSIGPAGNWDGKHPDGGGKFSIQFTSSQSGVMDIATGTFTFMGQD